MKLLAIGDIVAKTGIAMLQKTLPELRQKEDIDFCIANGENAGGVGLTPDDAEQILNCGVDLITLGNHTFAKQNITKFLDENPCIIRPYNMPNHLPGNGYAIIPLKKETLCVINLIGMLQMHHGNENPFFAIDRLLKTMEDKGYTFVIDFHAEATSEKNAMTYYLKDRVAALFGTHTHVQTNDARLIGNTGFITDLGMTGCIDTVIGFHPERSIDLFLGKLPVKHPTPEGKSMLSGAIFTIENNRCLNIEAVCIKEN